jgi:hypothetical protein
VRVVIMVLLIVFTFTSSPQHHLPKIGEYKSIP